MARVPLIQEQERPELADMIERFRAGRRGKLINIYRMLLNAPPLAESWFNHSNTVRWKTTLPGRLREIVIIRVGHLTKAQYVLRQHVPSLAVADAMRFRIGAPQDSSPRASAPPSPMPIP
jgi:alkylhydroperoxidase family enzyme